MEETLVEDKNYRINLLREILKENEKRLNDLSDNFNPLTGFRSVGKRTKVTIEGFPITTQWLPDVMLKDPFVKDLVKMGMTKYCAKLFPELPIDATYEVIIDKFF